MRCPHVFTYRTLSPAVDRNLGGYFLQEFLASEQPITVPTQVVNMVALSLFAPLLMNGSLMAPPGSTDGFCDPFYGHWPESGDCVEAMDQLANGPHSIPYTVDGDSGPHNLPLYVESGPCYRYNCRATM